MLFRRFKFLTENKPFKMLDLHCSKLLHSLALISLVLIIALLRYIFLT